MYFKIFQYEKLLNFDFKGFLDFEEIILLGVFTKRYNPESIYSVNKNVFIANCKRTFHPQLVLKCGEK